jgi:hypothetical protein
MVILPLITALAFMVNKPSTIMLPITSPSISLPLPSITLILTVSRCNDLLTLVIDLMNSYNENSGKILQQETIKLITTHYNAEDRIYGLGMRVNKDKEGRNIFGHNGSNDGYKIHFYCVPEKKYFYVHCFSYNPKYYFNPKYQVFDNIKKLLDL